MKMLMFALKVTVKARLSSIHCLLEANEAQAKFIEEYQK
jgi:hypothetical protein